MGQRRNNPQYAFQLRWGFGVIKIAFKMSATEHNLAATFMPNARKAAGILQEIHLNRTQFMTFKTFLRGENLDENADSEYKWRVCLALCFWHSVKTNPKQPTTKNTVGRWEEGIVSC